jgi:hypothetical protein
LKKAGHHQWACHLQQGHTYIQLIAPILVLVAQRPYKGEVSNGFGKLLK